MEQVTNTDSVLNDQEITKIILAILVKRLGGKAKITQKDIDEVAFGRLEEYRYPDGSPEFVLVERGMSA
jgi:hypothetical protein